MTEIVKAFVFVKVKNLMNDQEKGRREGSLSEFLSVRVKRELEIWSMRIKLTV